MNEGLRTKEYVCVEIRNKIIMIRSEVQSIDKTLDLTLKQRIRVVTRFFVKRGLKSLLYTAYQNQKVSPNLEVEGSVIT